MPLSKNIDIINKELNIIILLPLPCNRKNQECLQILNIGLNVKLDESIKENNKFCKKKLM